MRVIAALLCVAATIAVTTTASAATTWTEIGTAPGQIHDVDAERILFAQSAQNLAILDRRTEAVTAIPAPTPPNDNEFVASGFLSPHGALVLTRYTVDDGGNDEPFARLHEWRDGSLLLLEDDVAWDSLKVVGDVAVWRGNGQLRRRDLATGTTTSLGAGSASDVAANGDVVWTDFFTGVWRRRGATTEQLRADSATSHHSDPLTDGTNVVWREEQSSGGGSLQAHGPGGPLTLANTARDGIPAPGADYQADGGWIAFTRGADSLRSVWRRDPLGAETEIVAPSLLGRLVGLNDAGELWYRHGHPESNWRYFLAIPGRAPMELDAVPDEWRRGSGDHLFSAGGRWYQAVDGVLSRLQVDDPPVDGSETSIDTGPEGVVESLRPRRVHVLLHRARRDLRVPAGRRRVGRGLRVAAHIHRAGRRAAHLPRPSGGARRRRRPRAGVTGVGDRHVRSRAHPDRARGRERDR